MYQILIRTVRGGFENLLNQVRNHILIREPQVRMAHDHEVVATVGRGKWGSVVGALLRAPSRVSR